MDGLDAGWMRALMAAEATVFSIDIKQQVIRRILHEFFFNVRDSVCNKYYTRSVAKSPGNINTKMGMVVVVCCCADEPTLRRKKTFYLLTECQQIHVNKGAWSIKLLSTSKLGKCLVLNFNRTILIGPSRGSNQDRARTKERSCES